MKEIAVKHLRHTLLPVIAIVSAAGFTGCLDMGSKAGFPYRDLPVATSSAKAGEGHTVTLEGTPLALVGRGVKAGNRLRTANLIDTDLKPVNIVKTGGVVRIISIVSSIETPVCEQQTHYLSEKNQGLDEEVDLITISMDTPAVQSRFAKKAGIRNVTFLSDAPAGEFGKAHGLLIGKRHLLARAVMVVDSYNVIRYMQVTPELAQMPNMDQLFAMAFARARGEEIKDILDDPDSILVEPAGPQQQVP